MTLGEAMGRFPAEHRITAGLVVFALSDALGARDPHDCGMIGATVALDALVEAGVLPLAEAETIAGCDDPDRAVQAIVEALGRRLGDTEPLLTVVR